MGVVVVDGGVLAGGDALDTLVGKNGHALLCTDEVPLCEVGGVAYLELHIDGVACIQLFLPKGTAQIVEVEQVDAVAILCVGVVALRNVEDVLVDVLLHHEPGASAEKQTFALPDGMEPIAAMLTQYLACL